MRLRVAAAVLLSAAAAYYVYLPLPHGVCEPWKLMLLDALFRSSMTASDVVHGFGLCHRVHLLKWLVSAVEEIPARSCPAVTVSDAALGGVPTRVYQPRGGQGPRRGVIYFHGGGWALGSARMRSYDLLCRKMAEDLDAVVMSVDYGLAPEAVFPEQYLDALAASRSFLSAETWDRYGLDPSRLCISGDSAGGNLAAAVTQAFALDPSVPGQFKLQALIYPVLQALDFHTSSYQQNQAVPILYRPIMARFWLQYLNADPDLEPALLTNNHSSLLSSAVRSKINWTSLIPAHIRKHYLPLTGSEGVVKDFKGVVKDAEGVVKDAEGVVKDAEGVVKDLKGVVKDSEGVVKDLKGMVKDSEGVVKDFKGVVKGSEGVVKDLEGVVKDAEGVVKDSEDVVKDSEGVVKDLEGVVKDSEGVVKDSEGVVKGSEGVVKDLEGVVKDSEGVVKDSEGVVKGSEGVVKGLEGMVNDSEGVVKGLEGVVKDSEGVVKDSEGVVKDSEGVVKDSEGVVKDSEGVVKGSEGVVKDSEGVVKDSEGVVKDSEGVVKDSEGVVKDSEGVVKGSEGVADAFPVFLDVRAAPLLAESDVLSRTPKAYVMTCEFDVLRDDGLMYVARMRDAGVEVTNDHYDDGFHGCMVFAHLPMMSAVGRRSMDNYIRWLDQNL